MRSSLRQSMQPWRRRAVLAVAGLAFAPVGLASCSSGSTADTGLPALKGGCGRTTAASLPERIPLSIQAAGAGRIAEAAVCVNGQGPFPFAIATGVAKSVIVPSLVASLKLPGSAGTSTVIGGVTCSASAPETALHSWSIGGLALATQSVAVATLPSLGLRHQAMGLIGSDVLARFAAVRIDYPGKQLELATPEEAPPAHSVFILGKSSTAPPAGLVHSANPAGAVLTVLEGPNGTLVTTPVSFGKPQEQFTVDTASATSSVSASLVSSLPLAAAGHTAAKSGPGCSGTASQVHSGSWALGTVGLPDTMLVSSTFAGPVNAQVLGALGSDVLSSFGSVVLDYHGAHLWLGAG